MMQKRTRYTFRRTYLKNFDLEDFDPEGSYTSAEIEAYTDLLLLQDRRSNKEGPVVLFQEQVDQEWRREINPVAGVPDDEVTRQLSPDGQMMYNRTHPEGRKVNSKQARTEHGASYFR